MFRFIHMIGQPEYQAYLGGQGYRKTCGSVFYAYRPSDSPCQSSRHKILTRPGLDLPGRITAIMVFLDAFVADRWRN
jgi:hypothetical protein